MTAWLKCTSAWWLEHDLYLARQILDVSGVGDPVNLDPGGRNAIDLTDVSDFRLIDGGALGQVMKWEWHSSGPGGINPGWVPGLSSEV